MITEISISNFQSHRDSHLELSDGVTVLLGPSDSGKSAILRAMRWLIENKPTGEAFRSHWGGDTSISLVIDGKNITRARTKKDNQYLIDGNSFDKVGAGDSPQEVQHILDIDPVSLQWQHDTPFLLDESSAEVARKLNKAINLEAIDSSMTKITSMERSNAAELKTRENDVTIAEIAHRRFDGLDGLDGEMTAAENLERKLARDRTAQQGLNKLKESINRTMASLRPISQLAAIDVSPAERLLAEKKEKTNEAAALAEQIGRIEGMNQSIKRAERLLRHETEIEELENNWIELKRLGKEQHELSGVVNAMAQIIKDLDVSKQNLKRLTEHWEETMPDECPLCGRSCDCGQES